MDTEKIDVKNVRMNKSNVLVRGKGKETQEICTVEKHQAYWIKHFDKQKRGYTTVAWLNGVATLMAFSAATLGLIGDRDLAHQALTASSCLLGLFNVFCLKGTLKKITEYKDQLNAEYVKTIKNSQANAQEEMVR